MPQLTPQWILARHRRYGTVMSHAFAAAVVRRWPKAARAQVRYGDGHKYRKVRECFRNSRGVDPDAGRW